VLSIDRLVIGCDPPAILLHVAPVSRVHDAGNLRLSRTSDARSAECPAPATGFLDAKRCRAAGLHSANTADSDGGAAMRSWLGVAVVVGSVGLVGCMGAPGGGAEEGGGPGLVMLDEQAREAGFSLVTPEGRVTPVAPIELEEGTTLVGPGQRIPLVGAPGEVMVVTGKRGALVPRTLSTEIDGDAVRVSGSEQGVRTLAAALDAKVSGEGPWEVRAPGLFKSLSHLGDIEGVTAIDAIDLNATDVAAAALAAGAPKPFSARDPRYASFSSLGANAPACSDPAVGTWVSTPQNHSA